MKDVFGIYETATATDVADRWVRIGVAFDNKDGSQTILLDALPLSGRLIVRERPKTKKPTDERRAA